MIDHLALGTVQFGLPYGIANQVGQVSCEEMVAVLDHAWAAGIHTLDTAIDYGESEQRLGDIGVGQWQIISKLPEIPQACTDVASWVRDSVKGSLDRLRIPKLHGLLLHRPQQLLDSEGDALYRALVEVRDQNRAEKIGISISGPGELDALWPRYQFDLVQSPFNILDHRLVASGWLNRLNKAGAEVHIRSVFLQGLLLMDAVSRPEKFNRWQPLWEEWHRWLADHALTPLQVCLSFAMSQPGVSRIVVGVDSLQHLNEIVAVDHLGGVAFPKNLACVDLGLIDPSKWRKL